jgi:F-type H+-transporting ATPase subunit a
MKSLVALSIEKVLSLKTLVLIVFLACANAVCLASTESEHHADASGHATEVSHEANGHITEKFNPGKTIIEHVVDAHDWHIAGEGENSITIPLPIIIYSAQRGLDMFMSSSFHHGHQTYKGYMLQGNKVVAVNEMEATDAHHASVDHALTASLLDLSLTKNAFSIMISCLFMVLLFVSVANAYGKRAGQAPKGLQSLIEPLIIFVRDDIAKTNIGEKHYKRFLPFLLSVFFFIWLNNLLGLVPIFPGGTNITGNISVTLTLAVLVFIITSINGTKDYWMHVFAMPGVPKGVLLILTPIEILSVFLKPFVLMVRLFANITAGHIIALSFFSLIFIFGEMSAVGGYGVSVFSIAFTIFMGALELLVAFLQAYVFTLLTSLYFGAALESHDHHAHDAHSH